jgi:hypothetical protein
MLLRKNEIRGPDNGRLYISQIRVQAPEPGRDSLCFSLP